MLLECGHCGAPLDVQAGSQTYRCRYCGHASRIAETRTLMPQTPPQWRPPKQWRPPPHVPADSNTELQYRGNASPVVGVMVLTGVLLAVGVSVGAAVFASARGAKGGNPFSSKPSFDPASFDSVKFTETHAEMQKKLGGTGTDDKYLNVPMNGLFDYAIFDWDEKNPSHPLQFSMHQSKGGCTPEHEAARARVRKRLGPRFDGKNWYWGNSYFAFDEKCSMVSFHVSLSSPVDEPTDWKHQTEVLWSLVLIDVFGRPGKLAPADVAGILAKGYDLDTIAKAISKTTIDDAPSVKKLLPGATMRKSIGLDSEIPVDHPRFASVRVSWNNEKGGGIRSLDLSAFGNKLEAPIDMAKCLAPKMGAKLEVRETDYMNKKSDAYLTFKGASGSVSEYGAHIYASGFGSLKPEPIEAFLSAAGACR
ncbi:MAG: hypothetical protein ACXVEE_16075 [Polyangiales bacterium]